MRRRCVGDAELRLDPPVLRAPAREQCGHVDHVHDPVRRCIAHRQHGCNGRRDRQQQLSCVSASLLSKVPRRERDGNLLSVNIAMIFPLDVSDLILYR